MRDAEEKKQMEDLRPDIDIEPGKLQEDRGNEADISPPRGHPFPVVAIGGSAGALDAFLRLLRALPEDSGMAFVFVQHLDPHYESQLPEILANNTTMPVRTVADGMAVHPNEVFVIPPNATMVLEDGVLRLLQRNPGLHLPIDAFFESLAKVQGGRAIGVVLSGNASDGSHGVKAIKAECGLTFAQSEHTALHASMPRNAIATGAVDYVLPPADIGRELGYLSAHPFVRPPQKERAEEEVLPDGDGELKKLFHILRVRTKVDFSHYKVNTVRRRIGRRMVVTRTKALSEYVQLLDKSSEEVQELYRDLLICVTNFFRDPEAFDALKRILRDVLSSRTEDQPFRVWVPGCATGEEVYSIAMCLLELTDEMELNTPLQLFGTDISEIALGRARSATYLEAITQDVSPERLARFFVRVDRGYQMQKQIREACIFARHNITQDPSFGNMDLISCRNVLIYLDSELQRKVLPVFHYSLNATGLLLLGSAESITAASDLFSDVDKQCRIYRRKPAAIRLPLSLNLRPDGNAEPGTPEAGKAHTALDGIDLQRKVDLVFQSKYTPAAVVIDSNFQILEFRGRTGLYLEPRPGEPTFGLLRMVPAALSVPLRRAVDIAGKQAVSVRETGLAFEHRGEWRDVEIEVTPIPGTSREERYFLVVFEESAPGHASAPAPTPTPLHPEESPEYRSSLEGQIRALQKQNADLAESLRNANEDHEAHFEELRAANEEMRSANEELQSTNEELSTTKEELQSANEELTTVNEELQNRNQELGTVNSDLLNLLAAVDVAFLILDDDLRLRRFSPAAERLLGVKAIDVGSPARYLQGRLDLAALHPQMQRVLETLSIEQLDVQDEDGHWFSIKIRPYRTADARISGVVVVAVDIDPLKRMLRAAEEARDYAEGIIETVREPLLVLDADLRIQRATSAFYEVFRVSRTETEGRFLYDLGNGQWNTPRLRELLANALFRNDAFQDFEVVHNFPHIGRRHMRLNARRISLENDGQRRVLLAIEDMTERREEAEIRYQRLFETAKDGMLVFDAETEKLTDVNPYFLELTGFGREQLMGYRLSEMDCFRYADAAKDSVAEARQHEISRRDDVLLISRTGRKIQAELVANSYTVGGQIVVQVNVRDVTRRNQTLRALQESEERFRLFVESVRDYALFQTDPSGRIVSWNSGAERLLGYTEPEILGQPLSRVYTAGDIANGVPEGELETAQAAGSAEDERWHVRKDGSRFFASGVVTTVRDVTGRLRGFAKVMRDITESKKAQEQLKLQAQMLELAQDIIIVHRLDGTIVFWNHAAEKCYGWSKEDAAGQSVNAILKTVLPEPMDKIEAALLSEGRWEGELSHTRRDGTKITVWSRWTLQFDTEGKPLNVLQINSDITDRKRSDQQIRTSLREKEVLLKEVHHRVKNNLQIIASLLNLQAEYLADEKTQAILEEMNSRVRSIAAIHEMLYRAPDLSRVEFARYLNLLAKDLTSIFSANARGVRVNVNSGPTWLEVTQAVPCGLIVNELLTNSLKHAFPERRQGAVEISFERLDGQYVLEVADNGVGVPDQVDLQSAKSMGFQLLGLLVQQLKGSVQMDRSSGTRFIITFPPQEGARRNRNAEEAGS